MTLWLCLLYDLSKENLQLSVIEDRRTPNGFIADVFCVYDSLQEARAAALVASKGREPLCHRRHKIGGLRHFHLPEHHDRQSFLGKPVAVNLHFAWRD